MTVYRVPATRPRYPGNLVPAIHCDWLLVEMLSWLAAYVYMKNDRLNVVSHIIYDLYLPFALIQLHNRRHCNRYRLCRHVLHALPVASPCSMIPQRTVKQHHGTVSYCGVASRDSTLGDHSCRATVSHCGVASRDSIPGDHIVSAVLYRIAV